MAIDVHVHAKGTEDGNRVLRAMDRAGLERVVLMSAPPHFSLESETPATIGHKTVIDALAGTVAADPQRLIGFAWIEPTLSDAEEMVDYALGEKELSGVKMIPYHWYPDDERAQAVYRKVASHAKPMLFHSGILWMGTNTSKYCRPAEFEIMMEYPKIRFAVAHMSWPWTDECLAMAGKLQAIQPVRGHEWTCYVDITPGAPRIWQVEAMTKALAYLGDEHLIYGSDCSDPENGEALQRTLSEERSILRDVGASSEAIDRIVNSNALKWLGIS